MYQMTPLESIDYLVIGHITKDITPQGPRIGGTPAYSALTARALGMRPGIVTSFAGDVALDVLQGIPVVSFPTDVSTTFENIQTPDGRIQILHSVAPKLEFFMVPEAWRSVPIVHLGPVAQEVDPGLVRYFPSALIGLTPQGWLRAWDETGRVHSTDWVEENFLVSSAGAVVISVEDVGGDESRIEEMASYTRVLAVTEAHEGARLYWNGDVRRFRPPSLEEIDPTGAGDIFAAAFFYRLNSTRDPWEAARFATLLSAYSITRPGLEGIPTREEIENSLVEVY